MAGTAALGNHPSRRTKRWAIMSLIADTNSGFWPLRPASESGCGGGRGVECSQHQVAGHGRL